MNIELIKWAFPWVFPPIATLIAAYFGLVYGLKQIRVQKQLDFYGRQLREFYSPLLGCRYEILAKSNIRGKVSSAANEAWQDLCNKKNNNPAWSHDEAFKPYDKIINYDNAQFRNELLPLYEKMVAIFLEDGALAQAETWKWYPDLCEYVELWRRHLSGAVPPDVIKKLNHSEEKLLAFYNDLQKQTDTLRGKLLEKENFRCGLFKWRVNWLKMKKTN